MTKTATKKASINREEWLLKAVEEFRLDFTAASEVHERQWRIPKIVKVSVGFPSERALARKKTAVGQCWHGEVNPDGHPHIFISPLLGAEDAITTLAHELCHAVAPVRAGHKKAFARVWSAIGFEGQPTHDHAGPQLAKRVAEILKKLGPYPHKQLVPPPETEKKQTTRLIKLVCSCETPRIVRTTRQTIDVGLAAETAQVSGIRCSVCCDEFHEEDPDEDEE